MDALTSPQDIARTLGLLRPEFRWHVLRVVPGLEKQAWEGLRVRKYRVYWPTFESHKRRRGVLRQFTRSVFPGYQFILPHPAGWEPLRESPGVIGLLRVQDRFAVFDDADPSFRRIQEIEAELRKEPQKFPQFRIGQKVGITSGEEPFQICLRGELVALDSKGNADVLIDYFQRKVRVSVSAQQLNPA